MAINPVQPNMENKTVPSYREQKGAIKTDNNIKPLAPQGHLVHDTIVSVPKFWLKDIAYDIKAVKEGFQGKTNDHQQGRLNDVGLKLGGIGIAAYLASRTNDPKLRLMEYLGLGSFLAAMSLYPKIAINAPSRIIQGFDIGKEYIDDQGRKKSVFQDSNYIPFDMYQGDYPGEDLDIIGDRMGIPRDIKNRHDLIKEQMRKVATQNNTLWMLTAGFATPVMAALMCVGLEKLIVPAMEAVRNNNANSGIAAALKASGEMNLNPSEIESNKLSKEVEKILKNFEDKELPQEEFEKIITVMSDKSDSKLKDGIKEDLTKLLKSDTKYPADSEAIISIIKDNIPSANKTNLEKIFLLTPEEIEGAVKKIVSDSNELKEEQVRELKGELKKLFTSKGANSEYHKNFGNDLVNKIAESIKSKPKNYLSKTQIAQAVDFAKIIGDFKEKEKLVDKCISTKFEEAPQTILARYYEKFENTLFDVLDIKVKDMKQMKESEKFAKEILEEKLEALVKDETKYAKAIKKLSGVMSDMEVSLHGRTADKSHILDLIHATENVYNNTAKRLNNLDGKTFSRTINQLVKEEISDELTNRIHSREDLFKFLDGTLEPKKGIPEWTLQYGKENSKGVGSSKMNAISRIADRYQGVKDSFNRIILSMDMYKRGIPEGKYEAEVTKVGRSLLLGANSSQFNQKFNIINNPELYKDVMYTTWGDKKLTKATTDAFVKTDNTTGNVFERFTAYIQRLRQVMGNNTLDFTKPHHLVGGTDVNADYIQEALTRRSKFDLVAQDPISMVKKGAERKYGSAIWLRKASLIGASVLGAAVLAQFAFGKIKNPHNIQKQVSDDTNS